MFAVAQIGIKRFDKASAAQAVRGLPVATLLSCKIAFRFALRIPLVVKGSPARVDFVVHFPLSEVFQDILIGVANTSKSGAAIDGGRGRDVRVKLVALFTADGLLKRRVQAGVCNVGHHCVILVDAAENASGVVCLINEINDIEGLGLGIQLKFGIIGVKKLAFACGVNLQMDLAAIVVRCRSSAGCQIHSIQLTNGGIGICVHGGHLVLVETRLISGKFGEQIRAGKQANDGNRVLI